MQYLDLLGKTHKLNLSEHLEKADRKSELHLRVRACLETLWPLYSLFEEVPVSVRRNTLYLDFFMPQLKLCVEAHGEQHFKFNSFFYKSRADFLLAQNNDRMKKEWATLNRLTLLEFNYNEDETDWIAKIHDHYADMWTDCNDKS